jgi:type I restriction enzyme S subunit
VRELPPGWAWTTLGEIADIGPSRNRSKIGPATLVSFVPMANVEAGTGVLDPSETREWQQVSKGYVPFSEGDVLFARITPCMENGKVALARDLTNGLGAGSTEFHVVRARESIEPVFLLHYLLQIRIRRDARAVMQGAAGQLRVPASFLQTLALPLPPLAEQRRIVTEIEKQFTRLDATIASLRRAQANLKRCRKGETEAAFAAYSSAPTRRLGDLGEIVGGVTKGQKRKPGIPTRPVPYLRVANVQRGHLNLDQIKQIEATEEEICSLRLTPGDVLLNEGGDRDKLGRGWIWEGQIAECIHQNHVFRVRLNPLLAVPKFVSHYANHFGQKYFFDEGKQTTNLASINMTKLRALPIPSPPVAEQEKLVNGLEDHLSQIDDLDHSVDSNLRRAALLRQAILQKAFEGKLVPQDPSDEPASVLLERIRSTPKPAPRLKKQKNLWPQMNADERR